MFARLLVIGMHLDREALAGEDVFGEQRQLFAVGEPDFADMFARRRVEYRRQLRSPPRLFHILAPELHRRIATIGRRRCFIMRITSFVEVRGIASWSVMPTSASARQKKRKSCG